MPHSKPVLYRGSLRPAPDPRAGLIIMDKGDSVQIIYYACTAARTNVLDV